MEGLKRERTLLVGPRASLEIIGVRVRVKTPARTEWDKFKHLDETKFIVRTDNRRS
jgi:hypothetical protein